MLRVAFVRAPAHNSVRPLSVQFLVSRRRPSFCPDDARCRFDIPSHNGPFSLGIAAFAAFSADWTTAEHCLGSCRCDCSLRVRNPIFWLVEKQLGLIPTLIASAFSPLPILELVFFVIAFALGSEIVFRGIVFRTFAAYASIPAAVLGSCLLFALVCPFLGFLSALILGVSCAILFYKTRNLIASVVANALFILAGSGLTVYHGLIKR
jgi:Type II CAAX prenyl endopeptidase Rce1-like